MAKKTAKELKKGENIKLAGQECLIEEIEISDIGKQGTRKVRIAARTSSGERIVIVRPEDYPIDT
jgi:translation elongation factor P/translation initiation factor 5A